MLTGEIRSQIDRIWDAFWSGGISNPLEVIEQITYLLFLKRLDDLETAEELKANREKKPMQNRFFPEGKGQKEASLKRLSLPFLHAPRSPRDVRHHQRARFSVATHAGRRWYRLRPPHERRALHHPHPGAAGQSGRPDRQGADGGPR